MILAIKLTPKAHKNEIVGWIDEELHVKVRALPDKGQANEALIALIAKEYKVPKTAVKIVSGAKSRHKKLSIDSTILQANAEKS